MFLDALDFPFLNFTLLGCAEGPNFFLSPLGPRPPVGWPGLEGEETQSVSTFLLYYRSIIQSKLFFSAPRATPGPPRGSNSFVFKKQRIRFSCVVWPQHNRNLSEEENVFPPLPLPVHGQWRAKARGFPPTVLRIPASRDPSKLSFFLVFPCLSLKKTGKDQGYKKKKEYV